MISPVTRIRTQRPVARRIQPTADSIPHPTHAGALHTEAFMRKPVFLSLLAVLAVLLVSGIAQAQTATATMTGQVTEPSGAVVANATGRLKDAATGTKQETKTSTTGAYVFPNVAPGTYDITVDQAGFAQARVTGQRVEVGRQLTVNIPLSVGAANTIVEVKTTGVELQTLNSTIGNTVNSDMLQSLPSLGRDVSSFVTMQPGVSPDGSVGGTVVDQANFMLDGGNNSNDMDG